MTYPSLYHFPDGLTREQRIYLNSKFAQECESGVWISNDLGDKFEKFLLKEWQDCDVTIDDLKERFHRINCVTCGHLYWEKKQNEHFIRDPISPTAPHQTLRRN